MYNLYNMSYYDDDEPPMSFSDFAALDLNGKKGVLSSYGVTAKSIKDHFGVRGRAQWDALMDPLPQGAAAVADQTPMLDIFYRDQLLPTLVPPPSPGEQFNDDDIQAALVASAQGASDAFASSSSSEGKQNLPVFEAPEIPSVRDLKKKTVANLKKLAQENGIPPPEDGWGRKADIVAYIHGRRGEVAAPASSQLPSPMVNAEDLFSMGPEIRGW